MSKKILGNSYDSGNASVDSNCDTLCQVWENVDTSVIFWTTAVGLLFFIAIGYLVVRSSLLRDDVSNNKKLRERPYSLARMQMLWWVLVVFYGFLIVMTFHEWSLPEDRSLFTVINQTALALLGISFGGMTVSRVIDNQDKKNPDKIMHQEHLSSGRANMLSDIMSDQNGWSVHRLQQVLFSFAFGFVFIKECLYTGNTMPDFDAEWFALIGISLTGYVGVKTTENQAWKPNIMKSAYAHFQHLTTLPEPLILSKLDDSNPVSDELIAAIVKSKEEEDMPVDMHIRVDKLSAEAKSLLIEP